MNESAGEVWELDRIEGRYGPLVTFDRPAFIHPTAEIYGKNHFAEGSSVWPRVVMRAENHENVVGLFSNVQDFVLMHVGLKQGSIVGAHCSIAHHAVLHGCTIGDNCLIGINATVMDDAVIGDNSIVAGQSIVVTGTVIPANSIVAGAPAKVVKTRNNYVANRLNAFAYHHNALAYARGDHRAWHGEENRRAIDDEHRRLEAEFARMRTAE
ncbi:MAG: gamma carbonic anhydrase family protein [Alphaproteobacteria bacterium]|nr:gamma carbonic anhydrase family protein [Alphaproteobacteria bacterium]MDP6812655.1 gamma carbonic anhydrase family protein [Alphaproteobacteria bacterium]